VPNERFQLLEAKIKSKIVVRVGDSGKKLKLRHQQTQFRTCESRQQERSWQLFISQKFTDQHSDAAYARQNQAALDSPAVKSMKAPL